MRLNIQLRVVIGALGLVLMGTASVRASQVVFYGGNPVVGGAEEDQVDNNGDKTSVVAYDNFFVPAGRTYTVNDIFGEFGLPTGDSFSSADYEFRTNMDAGGGGTLVTSGELPVTISAGIGGPINGSNGLSAQRVQINLATPVILTGGSTGTTYWIGFAPDTTGISFNTFLGTSGPNSSTGVNLPATEDPFVHEVFTNPVTHQLVDTFITGPETSIGLDGTVPEPAGVVTGLASMAGAGLMRSRKRAL